MLNGGHVKKILVPCFAMLLILVCANGLTASTDGTGLHPFKFNAVTYGQLDGKGTYIAVGDNRSCAISQDNGENWFLNKLAAGGMHLRGIAYGQNKFVAVGYDMCIYVLCKEAPDKPQYTWRLLSNKAWSSQVSLRAITYGNGMFVAVGDKNIIMISYDGEHWDIIRQEEFAENHTLYGITYDNGRFVAVGEDCKMLVSLDGINWDYISYDDWGSTPELFAVTYGNGHFLAVGEDWKVGWSKDGYIWNWASRLQTEEKQPWLWLLENLYGATYAQGKYIVVGQDNSIYVSKKPSTTIWFSWKRVSDDNWGEDPGLYSVIYANNQFVAVGGNNWGYVVTSPDGEKWTKKPLWLPHPNDPQTAF